jgi:hypothetical protein
MSSQKIVNRQMHRRQQTAEGAHHPLHSLQRLLMVQQTVLHVGQSSPLTEAHISNFLNHKRALSLEGLDRVLAAQELTIDQLLPVELLAAAATPASPEPIEIVPVVSSSAAMEEARISPAAIIETIHLSASRLADNRARPSPKSLNLQRFVAIRADVQQAAGMAPLLAPGTVAVIDRHYNSLAPYRAHEPTLYAVRSGNALLLRFADFEHNCIILRPAATSCSVQLLPLAPNETPADYLVGRVCLLFSEL